MQCTYKRRRPPTSTSSAEPIPSEVISGDGRESSFVPSPPQPTKSTTARTTTENHAATGRSLTPTRAPCKLHARLDPEHRRRRQARLLRTSLGTGSPPPDPRTGTVAMRQTEQPAWPSVDDSCQAYGAVCSVESSAGRAGAPSALGAGHFWFR